MRFHIFHILIHVTKKLIAEAVGALEGRETVQGLVWRRRLYTLILPQFRPTCWVCMFMLIKILSDLTI